jgi:uncharacterized protein (DUF3820 family)
MYALPFGVHAGRDITTVDGDYLSWLASREIKSNSLRRALDAELARRGLEPKQPQTQTSPTRPSPSPTPARASAGDLAQVREALDLVDRAARQLEQFLETHGR